MVLWVARSLGLFTVLLGVGTSFEARAQDDQTRRVVVIRATDVSERLRRQVEDVLAQDFTIVGDMGYLRDAREQSLPRVGDDTLELLLPLQSVDMAVVLRRAGRGAIDAEFREGATGEPLGTTTVRVPGGRLGWAGKQALAGAAHQRADSAAPAPQPNAAGATPDTSGDDAAGEASEAGVSGWEQDPEREAGPSAATGEQRALPVELQVGLGMASRDISFGAEGGVREMGTGLLPAVSLGLRLGPPSDARPGLALSLRYQTSFAGEIDEQHVDGTVHPLGIRTQRFSGALAGGIAMSDSLVFAPQLGYSLRNLRPDAHHLLTPSYTLSGPHAALIFLWRASEALVLRLGPEAQWIAQVGKEARDVGAQTGGLGLAVEASAGLRIARGLRVDVGYRQGWAWLSTNTGHRFEDIERYLSAQALWTP